MKTEQKILIKEDSKPYLIECPEEPKVTPSTPTEEGAKLWEDFFEALEQAKQSAVPFDKPEDVIELLQNTTDRLIHRRPDGNTYSIPTGYRVEVIQTCVAKGNRDSCANETCWDLNECQRSPRLQVAKLTAIKEL